MPRSRGRRPFYEIKNGERIYLCTYKGCRQPATEQIYNHNVCEKHINAMKQLVEHPPMHRKEAKSMFTTQFKLSVAFLICAIAIIVLAFFNVALNKRVSQLKNQPAKVVVKQVVVTATPMPTASPSGFFKKIIQSVSPSPVK